jgi:hypothetical protein
MKNKNAKKTKNSKPAIIVLEKIDFSDEKSFQKIKYKRNLKNGKC